MVNLDTVGRLGGGKILVLGAGSADEWIHIVNGAGYVTGAPVSAVMDDPGGSDQKSFVEAGIPAVQVFTGANAGLSCQPTDTPDRSTVQASSRSRRSRASCVAYSCRRDKPLTSKLGGAAPKTAAAPSGERRASLGSIPDYELPGPGVRITGTTPGSPAEKAGLKEGDVITKLGSTPVTSLRELSEALKALAPGDTVDVTVLREGQSVTFQATLAAR
jgi:membrane-associated protease RseP (regulator of RpoE activity)